MSQVAMNSPNIPPPPPAPPPNISPKRIQNTHRIVQQTVCDRLLPAKVEAKKLCSRLIDRLNLSSETYLISHLQEVTPIIQDGPMCGLVAVCMASRLLQKSSAIGISQVFEIAKDLGYTLQGEMFSAAQMGELSTLLLRSHAEVLEDPSSDSNRTKIITALLKGDLVLVPYDADGNHEPCMRRGQKAHWAILTGILLTYDYLEDRYLDVFDRDDQLPQLYYTKPHNGHQIDMFSTHCQNDLCDMLSDRITKALDIYVYAKQGKSVHTGLWSLDTLLKSNMNLMELDPKVAAERDNYIVPSEGIQGGLCNQLIVISKRS